MTFLKKRWFFIFGILGVWLGCSQLSAQTQQKNMAWRYDAHGRIEQVTYPGVHMSPTGTTSSYTHKPLGGHDTLMYGGKNVISQTNYNNYHGKPTKVVYSGQWDAGYSEAYYSYDQMMRLSRNRVHIKGVKTYDARYYHYDATGSLTGFLRSDAYVSGTDGYFYFGYDDHGQLESATLGSDSAEYRYDQVGNLIYSGELDSGEFYFSPRSNTYENGNPYHHDEYTYDSAGRLVEDEDYTYSYYDEGRLKAIFDRATGNPIEHYLYDADGNRVRTLSENKVVYAYHDSSETLVANETYDAEGSFLQHTDFLFHNGSTVAKVTYDSSETPKMEYRFTDYLGSPAVRWSRDGVSQQQYEAFGKQMITGDQNFHDGSYGFTGHADDKSGLTFMRARYYDNNTARFLTPDPLRSFNKGRPKSFNLYQYVYNSPMSIVDPTGLEGEKDTNIVDSVHFQITVHSWKSLLSQSGLKVFPLPVGPNVKQFLKSTDTLQIIYNGPVLINEGDLIDFDVDTIIKNQGLLEAVYRDMLEFQARIQEMRRVERINRMIMDANASEQAARATWTTLGAKTKQIQFDTLVSGIFFAASLGASSGWKYILNDLLKIEAGLSTIESATGHTVGNDYSTLLRVATGGASNIVKARKAFVTQGGLLKRSNGAPHESAISNMPDPVSLRGGGVSGANLAVEHSSNDN